jgi:hypothetical protein
MPMMAAYAARIPVATTASTVKKSTKALNKPPKFSPLSYKRIAAAAIRDSPAGFPPAVRLLNLPALTLAAVSK